MKIVIIGGGIAAVYLANNILKKDPSVEVQIVSKEPYYPYDRIHLCALVDHTSSLDDIHLEINPKVKMVLNQEITAIDPQSKHLFSKDETFSYDYLIVATGSLPKELFDIKDVANATTFRSADDSFHIAHGIKDKNVVLMGVGPIGIELLDTLMKMREPKKIYLISRGEHLYDKDLDPKAVDLIQEIFEADPRITLLFNDEIKDVVKKGRMIEKVQTKHLSIENPFVIFGVGIVPNVAFAKGSVTVDKGIVVDAKMRSSDPFIFAVGEAAQLDSGFIAGRVKECTLQANIAIDTILGIKDERFKEEVSVDGLKVGSFLFTDVRSPLYNPKDKNNETLVISSQKDHRIDQYITNDDKVMRIIGINTNVDVAKIQEMVQSQKKIDASYLYESRHLSERGRLICSCTNMAEQDIVTLVQKHQAQNFAELSKVSQAGRVCGRCKQDVVKLIEVSKVPAGKSTMTDTKRSELEAVEKRIKKYNDLHPHNKIDSTNLTGALASFDLNQEYNKWVSMITANLRLHPDYEGVVKQSVEQLNKVPIIWLELADCTGNSEAFIKSAHPSVDELILQYVSLDYHELLMAASGDQSEVSLDQIIKEDAGKYILIVEGAVPLGMEGKFLRIGPKGETGEALLKRVAKDAAAVIAVGSCAYDGGVVAAQPNPTGAVGVSEALGRDDIINLPGCPTNPINVVGTLLHYIMFDELPELDHKNRPVWAYSQRIHDNCERRGHYDNDEFVLEWGDEGAKKGWCLFKMGCKGPYANLNCSLVKFNEGTSWPVQAGHGCFACGQGKIAFDHLANNREVSDEVKALLAKEEHE